MLVEQAQTAGPGAVEALTEQGRRFQVMWRCPLAGYTPHTSKDDLPPECRDAVDSTAKITGHDDACTCPVAYTGTTWVHEVLRARAARDKGQLDEYLQAPASAALWDAMFTVDEIEAKRARSEFEKWKREHPPPEKQGKR